MSTAVLLGQSLALCCMSMATASVGELERSTHATCHSVTDTSTQANEADILQSDKHATSRQDLHRPPGVQANCCDNDISQLPAPSSRQWSGDQQLPEFIAVFPEHFSIDSISQTSNLTHPDFRQHFSSSPYFLINCAFLE